MGGGACVYVRDQGVIPKSRKTSMNNIDKETKQSFGNIVF